MRRLMRQVLAGDRPAHAALLTMATQVLVVLLNVATGVITARLLGPAGRGVFAAATLWPVFLSGVAVLGLPSALVFHLKRAEAERDAIVTAGLLLALGTALLATAVGAVLVAGAMAHYGRREVLLGWFCIVWTGPYLLTLVLRQVMATYGRIRAFNVSCYLPPLLYLALLGPACLLTPLTPGIAALCLMVPSGMVLSWMILDLRRVWRPDLRGVGTWAQRLAAYAVRMAPGDLVAGVLASVDRLVLVALLAPAELGLYAVAYSLSRLVLVLQTVASAVLFPQMAGRAPEDAKRLHDHAFRLVLYAVAAAVLVATVAGRPVLALVYGEDFARAAPILDVLIVEAGLTCAGQVAGQLFLALRLPGWVSAAQGASLATAAAGLVLLVPRLGALGAALALALAGVVRLAVLLPGIPWRLRLGLPRLHLTRGDVLFVRSRML